jgi:starch phosphorylase
VSDPKSNKPGKPNKPAAKKLAPKKPAPKKSTPKNPEAATEPAPGPTPGIDALTELALNLYWSWNHMSDELWEALDSYLWETTQNPWVILQTVSNDKVNALLKTPKFQERLSTLLQRKRAFLSAESWLQKEHPGTALSAVAYFSMEFMLTEALPIYSGGLGNVAGDQMKAASQLGIPVVGVGLLWGQGYFRQDFDADGWQRVLYPVNDPGQLPIRPLRRPDGEWLRFQIQLPGEKIWLRCWEVLIGRTTLYLLDANDFANSAAQRGITSELYGGDAEMRLRQEIVLGIGGWRLLRALGLHPEVCHLNEGHAAFAVLERARCYMEDHHVPFELALTVTRPGNVFTTHTAVSAGFDRFDPELVKKYLGSYASDQLAIPMENLLALGRQNAGDSFEFFNMAYLALRGSGQVNGVSKLHGQVSREIFQPLFPRWPQAEIPIGSVTNGIHVPTWDSPEADALWTKACGPDRWRGVPSTTDDIRRVADTDLWQMRTQSRKTMIGRVRQRYARQLTAEGAPSPEAAQILDENALTIGFARRFATYKRPTLLLHDPARLIRLLSDPNRPLQLVLAGKAHPADLPGQALVKQWNDFARRPEVHGRVVFLSDYDMQMAQELVQGMDLWINTPRRPWEACGTSGMKVLVNGGLNLSELDGWWAEAYTPEVGWALGDGKEHDADPAWDAAEAETLYTLLENEVIPEFYERTPEGMPVKWLHHIRESMAQLTQEFSANRAIREYTEGHYLPAASGYAERAANDSALGTSLLQWQKNMEQHWNSIHFGNLQIESNDSHHQFRLEVFPGEIPPDNLTVELYAEPVSEGGPIHVTMTIDNSNKQPASPGALLYSAEVPATRAPGDYTPRIIPRRPAALLPFESTQILWKS